MTEKPLPVRRRPVCAAALAAGLALAAGAPLASAAVNPSVSPSSAIAGATAGPVTFTFTSTTATTSRLMLIVPPVTSGSPWALPQTTNAAAPGYVTFSRGTCAYARNAGAVRGSAPDRVIVSFSCAANQRFQVVYRPGTIPTFSATYTFGTRLDTGSGYGAVQSNSPKVRVDAAALAALRVQTPANLTAGTPFDTIVTAVDRFGNRRFKETFTVTGGLEGPLDEFTSAPLVQGRTTLRITPKGAGARTFSAINADESIVGTAPTTVAAGPTAALALEFPNFQAFALPQQRTGNNGVTPVDAYGNSTASTYKGTIRWTSTDPLATLPPQYTFNDPTAPVSFTQVQFRTAGSQRVTVTDTADSSITGGKDITVASTRAVDDTATILDPYHARTDGTRIDVLFNDVPNVLIFNPKRVASATTPTYVDDNGDTVEVGSAAPAPDGRGLVVRLARPVSGAVDGREYCETDEPCDLPALTVGYTMSDGVNPPTSAKVTVKVASPGFTPVSAPVGFVVADDLSGIVIEGDEEDLTIPVGAKLKITEIEATDQDKGTLVVQAQYLFNNVSVDLKLDLGTAEPGAAKEGDSVQLEVASCITALLVVVCADGSERLASESQLVSGSLVPTPPIDTGANDENATPRPVVFLGGFRCDLVCLTDGFPQFVTR